MQNHSKLNSAFAHSLRIDLSRITDQLTFNTIEEWDSVAHMALITEIEKIFDVMLDTDDILELSSVVKAREILSKHGVSFQD
jgi:acyl carrier protein